MTHMTRKPFRSESFSFALDARVLLDAEGMQSAVTPLMESTSLSNFDALPIAGAMMAHMPASQQAHEIVFVDSAVENLADVLNGINPDAEVHVIGAHDNGLDVITRVLGGRDELSAVHIISHGTNGGLQLGSVNLTNESLQNNARLISGWGDAIASDGDILLYGCNVASGSAGRVLVDSLADLTHADVAASTDLTGNAARGGDWDLEYQHGVIDHGIVLSLDTQHHYQGIFNAAPVPAADNFNGVKNTVVTGNVLNNNGFGADSDPESNPLSVTSGTFATAKGGSVTVATNGNFTFTPLNNFTGFDSFSYTLSDGTSTSVGQSLIYVKATTSSGGGNGNPPVTTGLKLNLDAQDVDGNGVSDSNANGATTKDWYDSSGIGTQELFRDQNNNMVYNTSAFGNRGGWNLATNTTALLSSVGSSPSQSGDDEIDNNGNFTLGISFQTGSDLSGHQNLYATGTNNGGFQVAIEEGGNLYVSNIGIGWSAAPINLGALSTNSSYVLMVRQTGPSNLLEAYLHNGTSESSGNTNSAATGTDLSGYGTGVGTSYNSIYDVTNNNGTQYSNNQSVFKGTLGQVVFYDATLSNTDRTSVRDYLTGRWLGVGGAATPAHSAIDLTNINGDVLSYTANSGAFVLDQGGNAVSDADATNTLIRGGNLTVSFGGTHQANDVLTIRNQGTGAGQIGVSGGSFTLAGVTMGTFTGGTGSSDLVITFNASATVATLDALLKNITYSNNLASPNTTMRAVGFVLQDSANNYSNGVEVNVRVDINDAPVLFNTGTMNLTPVAEDATAPAGNTIASIVATSTANGSNAITDVDAGAVEGIAIHALSGAGVWQYTIDGGSNWLNVGAVSGTSALLLRATDSLRYVPAANETGTAVADVTFRAWDQTSGSAGNKVDSSVNGGSTAFSSAFENATVDVTAGNAPTLDNALIDQVVNEDSALSYIFAANSFGELDGDTVTFSATLADGSALPGWLSFDSSTRTFSGTPIDANVGVISVRVTATDVDGSAIDIFTITINNTEDAPTILQPLVDQTATDGTAFSYGFLANSFDDVDIDSGDSLTYTATLVDGSPLPSWLTFNAATRTFSGTPATVDVGTLSIRVTATDADGPLQVFDDFDLTVSAATVITPPPVVPVPEVPVVVDVAPVPVAIPETPVVVAPPPIVEPDTAPNAEGERILRETINFLDLQQNLIRPVLIESLKNNQQDEAARIVMPQGDIGQDNIILDALDNNNGAVLTNNARIINMAPLIVESSQSTQDVTGDDSTRLLNPRTINDTGNGNDVSDSTVSDTVQSDDATTVVANQKATIKSDAQAVIPEEAILVQPEKTVKEVIQSKPALEEQLEEDEAKVDEILSWFAAPPVALKNMAQQ
ncbi:MAG: DUF4347 domain-containing protein [Rickettsiales bacterium]|nr:DUF4347 domain-containing protein [Rickettsiales bacterium]